MSEAERSVTLHIPKVELHDYRAGSFDSLQPLEPGGDYRLNNIPPGKLQLDPERLVDDFVTVPLDSKDLRVKPHDTHASIQAPWPSALKCVRQLERGCDPLFNEDVNPRELGYISYLTYFLKDGEKPSLRRNGKIIWTSDAGGAKDTRLHVFADSGQMLTPDTYSEHMKVAYGAFNDQIFAKPFDLMPNLQTPMQFNPAAQSPDIPDSEAVDLWAIGQSQDQTEASGNCLSVFLLD